MILARFPSTFLTWLVGTWNCKHQQFRKPSSVAKVLSMTQSKTGDKDCLLDPSVPAAEGADCPRAVIASPPGAQTRDAVGPQAGPRPLGGTHRWVVGCPFRLTSLTWPELRPDLSVPIKRYTAVAPAWGITAMLQGERNCPSTPAAPLCTAAGCPRALTTTGSGTAQSKVPSLWSY